MSRIGCDEPAAANPSPRARASGAALSDAYLQHWPDGAYPAALAGHPVVNVPWQAADAYCRWRNGRLPTEAEWEYAARGGLPDRHFPWGDDPPDPSRANSMASGFGTTVRAGSYPPNGYGIYDMSGNVWEWTADRWSPETPSTAVAASPVHATSSMAGVDERYVIRGGSWGGAPVNLRVAYRDSHRATDARDFVGFRCARARVGSHLRSSHP